MLGRPWIQIRMPPATNLMFFYINKALSAKNLTGKAFEIADKFRELFLLWNDLALFAVLI